VTQKEIAASLSLSEAKVSRLLSKAEREGMMRVRIEVDPPRVSELEAELRNRFGLFDAVVIPSLEEGKEWAARASVGIAAARYFEWLTKEGSRIALSAGTTLTQMVEHLTPGRFRELKVYPLSVMDLGLRAYAAEVVRFFPNTLVVAMRAKYGGRVQAFTFQVASGSMVSDEHEKMMILERNGIDDLFEEAKEADIFLTEIDTLKQIDHRAERILRYYGVDVEELQRKALGYINFQAFDAEHILTEEIEGLDRMINVSLAHLGGMSARPGKHVIAVAAGEDRIEAVAASLSPNIRCYDILITDEAIAEGVLGLM
jgi:DNA-binding transcriptional regulator LsrR (DeoR family)